MESRSRPRARLLVLVSGRGQNLAALLQACASGAIRANVVAAISDHGRGEGLERARQARIPAIVKSKPRHQDRREYDAELADLSGSFHPDWILLDGWDRPLTSAFLNHFPERVLALHPALPGAFPGTHAIERAYYAYCRGEIDHTGIMLRFLAADSGEGMVLEQQTIPIAADDTLESLEARVNATGPALLVAAIKRLSESR